MIYEILLSDIYFYLHFHIVINRKKNLGKKMLTKTE